MSDYIEKAGALLLRVVADGGQILACGNGGSAADAEHFVAELLGRMSRERPPMPGIALTSAPTVTAIGNDYGFEWVFSRQIKGLGRPGDALVMLTTSGLSPNILRAYGTAGDQEMWTVALTGPMDGPLCGADIHIAARGENPQRIQEQHKRVLHDIVGYMEGKLQEAQNDSSESGQ
jgi:D-sedoheptulose 7-phosphate isomerase